MPMGPAGLGMGGDLPQGSRKEPLPGCRAGSREGVESVAAGSRRGACLRGRPKEPGQAVARAVVGNMWPEAYLGQRQGGWTEGQREGLVACTGPGDLGREPQDTEAEVGGPRRDGNRQNKVAPAERYLPFSLVRGEPGPVQTPPSLPPSTGWGHRASRRHRFAAKCHWLSPPWVSREGGILRTGNSLLGEPLPGPRPLACPLLPGIVLSTAERDVMVQKPPEGKG